MSLIATALKHMLAAGLPHDQIVAAVAEMEASRAGGSPAERKRAYDRAYHQSRRAKAARRRTTSYDSGESYDALPPSLPPTPPNLTTNPRPPSPPKGGSSPTGDARPARKRVRGKSRVPADWSPRPEDLRVAVEEEGLTPGEIERELARMRDCHFHFGRTDWDAVFRNWIRKAKDLKPRHDRPDPNSGKLAARQANLERAISGFDAAADRLKRR